MDTLDRTELEKLEDMALHSTSSFDREKAMKKLIQYGEKGIREVHGSLKKVTFRAHTSIAEKAVRILLKMAFSGIVEAIKDLEEIALTYGREVCSMGSSFNLITNYENGAGLLAFNGLVDLAMKGSAEAVLSLKKMVEIELDVAFNSGVGMERYTAVQYLGKMGEIGIDGAIAALKTIALKHKDKNEKAHASKELLELRKKDIKGVADVLREIREDDTNNQDNISAAS